MLTGAAFKFRIDSTIELLEIIATKRAESIDGDEDERGEQETGKENAYRPAG